MWATLSLSDYSPGRICFELSSYMTGYALSLSVLILSHWPSIVHYIILEPLAATGSERTETLNLKETVEYSSQHKAGIQPETIHASSSPSSIGLRCNRIVEYVSPHRRLGTIFLLPDQTPQSEPLIPPDGERYSTTISVDSRLSIADSIPTLPILVCKNRSSSKWRDQVSPIHLRVPPAQLTTPSRSQMLLSRRSPSSSSLVRPCSCFSSFCPA